MRPSALDFGGARMDSCVTGPGGRCGASLRTATYPPRRDRLRLAFRTLHISSGTFPVGGLRMELPLAEVVPIWRTVREGGVTALITPALDYVSGLELGTKD